MKNKILVTGGAGFIGSEFVRRLADRYPIIVVDKLTYAGDRARLKEVADKIKFYKYDICSTKRISEIFKKEKPQIVVHFAAETHVDNSLDDISPFIESNIMGTQNLIHLSMRHKVKKFLHISTDEVYGQSQRGRFKETAPIRPRNPYSATKAAAELLVSSHVKSFGFPGIVIRPSNNYGPWQFPEKFLPVAITRTLKGKKIPVYGRGRQIREWMHVTDCAAAMELTLQKGKIGEIYNIGSYVEKPNAETARMILKEMGLPQNRIQFVKDRPGHDFRYSVDCRKIRSLGWKPGIPFRRGLKNTIRWYQSHETWWRKKT